MASSILEKDIQEFSLFARRLAKKLKKMGLQTGYDLLHHYPFRYEDFSLRKDIKDLRPGEKATILARLDLLQNRRGAFSSKIVTEAIFSDKTGRIKAVWFNQPYLTKYLHPGDEVFLAGVVSADFHILQFKSPEYEKKAGVNIHTGRLVPIYPLTAGLTNKQLRALIYPFLAKVENLVKDWLPGDWQRQYQLLPLSFALKNIHFPESREKARLARQRLAFEEIFFWQLKNYLARQKIKEQKAFSLPLNLEKLKNFLTTLPFTLTNGQKKALWSILSDMQKKKPMNRLLEGDVGSGKSIVVLGAMLMAAWNGYQAAYMAPTEILARQQFFSFAKFCAKEEIFLALFTRGEKKICFQGKVEEATTRDLLKKIKEAQISLVIGTHSLIQDKISFGKLNLAIVDEQHRFGVKQRGQLAQKANLPAGYALHFLSLTATPIPRTLHLAFRGDLDLSLIKELPSGRKKVITQVATESERVKVYSFILERLKEGEQVFIICPLVSESDKLGVKSVTQEYERLRQGPLAAYEIGVLHGRLKSEEKEKIMEDFSQGRLKILLATSVVEVGIDVPQATVMVIEGAERFGLAQLHQFRGRVGRGEKQAYCFLFTSSGQTEAEERLKIFSRLTDGFALARYDLKRRGPGEVFGKSQSGFPEFKIADIFDEDLIKQAQEIRKRIFALPASEQEKIKEKWSASLKQWEQEWRPE